MQLAVKKHGKSAAHQATVDVCSAVGAAHQLCVEYARRLFITLQRAYNTLHAHSRLGGGHYLCWGASWGTVEWLPAV